MWTPATVVSECAATVASDTPPIPANLFRLGLDAVWRAGLRESVFFSSRPVTYALEIALFITVPGLVPI